MRFKGAIHCFLSVSIAILAARPPASAQEKLPQPDPVDRNQWVKMPPGQIKIKSAYGADRKGRITTFKLDAFEIMKSETTVGQYLKCIQAKACKPVAKISCSSSTQICLNATKRLQLEPKDNPVTNSNWFMADTFCRWIGGRLPREAEWEYAARGAGHEVEYPWGNKPATCDSAVMHDKKLGAACGMKRALSACSRPRGNTKHGLCDMAGNVWEWVYDRYALNRR